VRAAAVARVLTDNSHSKRENAVILSVLRGPDAAVAAIAARYVSTVYADKFASALRELTSHDSPEVSFWSKATLLRDNRPGYPQHDEDREFWERLVRECAAREIRGRAMWNMLEGVVRHSPWPQVREAALAAAGPARGWTKRFASAALRFESRKTRLGALRRLSGWNSYPPLDQEDLKHALEDRDRSVRHAALRLVDRFGSSRDPVWFEEAVRSLPDDTRPFAKRVAERVACRATFAEPGYGFLLTFDPIVVNYGDEHLAAGSGFTLAYATMFSWADWADMVFWFGFSTSEHPQEADARAGRLNRFFADVSILGWRGSNASMMWVLGLGASEVEYDDGDTAWGGSPRTGILLQRSLARKASVFMKASVEPMIPGGVALATSAGLVLMW